MLNYKEINKQAVKANLNALAHILQTASGLANEAQEAINKGEQNLAIGTLDSFDKTLEACLSLYSASITIHRLK